MLNLTSSQGLSLAATVPTHTRRLPSCPRPHRAHYRPFRSARSTSPCRAGGRFSSKHRKDKTPTRDAAPRNPAQRGERSIGRIKPLPEMPRRGTPPSAVNERVCASQRLLRLPVLAQRPGKQKAWRLWQRRVITELRSRAPGVGQLRWPVGRRRRHLLHGCAPKPLGQRPLRQRLRHMGGCEVLSMETHEVARHSERPVGTFAGTR